MDEQFDIQNYLAHGVERVIRAYLDDLVESAKDGETIVIDNIMSIKLVETENGDVKLRGRVSPSLKSKLYVKANNTMGIDD